MTCTGFAGSDSAALGDRRGAARGITAAVALRRQEWFSTPMTDAKPEDFKAWRAGAHTDFDCLTLLHQKVGQSGLQLCPGKESDDLEWTDVPPIAGVITCNIGDMLMRWSDDQLKSTLHRVRMPQPDEYQGSRYSMPFFCQANKDAIIQGPRKAYDPITAHDYLQQRIAANFAK